MRKTSAIRWNDATRTPTIVPSRQKFAPANAVQRVATYHPKFWRSKAGPKSRLAVLVVSPAPRVWRPAAVAAVWSQYEAAPARATAAPPAPTAGAAAPSARTAQTRRSAVEAIRSRSTFHQAIVTSIRAKCTCSHPYPINRSKRSALKARRWVAVVAL